MILHIAHSHLSAIMTSEKPDALKARELNEYEALAAEHDIRFTAHNMNTLQVQADISQSNPAKLFAYLDAIGCQCVDVDVPQDLTCWSRGVEVFGLQKYFNAKAQNLSDAEARDSLKASMRGLPISEIHDAVNRLLIKAAVAPPQVSMTEEEIVKDLTDAGYLVPTASRLDRDEDSEREQQLMQNWQQDIPKRKPRPGQDPSDWMTYSE